MPLIKAPALSQAAAAGRPNRRLSCDRYGVGRGGAVRAMIHSSPQVARAARIFKIHPSAINRTLPALLMPCTLIWYAVPSCCQAITT